MKVGVEMYKYLCKECNENPVTTILEISSNLSMDLCPVCFNEIISQLMAIDFKELETKKISYKDKQGDQYIVCIERDYQNDIGYEIKHSINDGSDHNVSIMGKIDCDKKDIWNQLDSIIKSTIDTRCLELVDYPFGEAQDQLIGNEAMTLQTY